MGAYPSITGNSQAASPFQLVTRPPNTFRQSPDTDVFNFGIVAAVSNGASLTYSMQVTADPIPSNSGNWVDHDVITALTASKVSNIAYPITAYRLNVTAYSGGSVTLGVSWW